MSAEENEEQSEYKVKHFLDKLFLTFDGRLYTQLVINIVLLCQKKKPLKTKVNQLLRRASYGSSVSEGKHMNGNLHQESKVRSLKCTCLPWHSNNLRHFTSNTTSLNNTVDFSFVKPKQDGDITKKSVIKKDSFRRWSEVKHQLNIFQTSKWKRFERAWETTWFIESHLSVSTLKIVNKMPIFLKFLGCIYRLYSVNYSDNDESIRNELHNNILVSSCK